MTQVRLKRLYDLPSPDGGIASSSIACGLGI
jgi:hypothetical protein